MLCADDQQQKDFWLLCDKGGEKTLVEDTNLLVWESFVNGKNFHGHHERLLLFCGYEDDIKAEGKEDEDSERKHKSVIM